MPDFLEPLEEIETEHRNLLNIALNKKNTKIGRSSSNQATSLPVIAHSSSSRPTSVDLERCRKEHLISKGYVDERNLPTDKYYDYLKDSTKPFKGNLNLNDINLLKKIDKNAENWEIFLKESTSLYLYKRGISLNKAQYFNEKGELAGPIKDYIRNENDKFIRSRFSSQHVSLINIIIENNFNINEEIYNKYGFKSKWSDQKMKIDWMKSNNILNEDLKLTEYGKYLRLSKIKPIRIDEINERDLKILDWIKTNDENKLGLNTKRNALSRIYRFQASGYIDENFKITSELDNIIVSKKEELNNDPRPAWIKESRNPRLDDLNNSELNLVKTLALESPFLSHRQLQDRFDLNDQNIRKLKSGILIEKEIHARGKRTTCFALHWNTKNILKEAGINRTLKGRFQKDSHVYHDLMVYESIQHAKTLMSNQDNEVAEIIHERSQFQSKTSANDNKGMCHADAVAKDKSGSETAIEFGRYSVNRMIHKITHFSQSNVLVYTDSQSMLRSYEIEYKKQVQRKIIPQKNVKFIYLPSIQI